jgi:hypothetical protein
MAGDAVPFRRIEVAPQRLSGWIGAFAGRHGAVSAESDGATATFRAADGAAAECQIPFPPIAPTSTDASSVPTSTDASSVPTSTDPSSVPASDAVRLAQQIAAHAMTDRIVAVLLVRLGGYAAGVFTGADPTLTASKVGSRLVHGRSAAGGTSQQRFARRRENQAHQALAAAADTAAAVFGPYADRLDAVVLGGDRRGIAGLRNDVRLAPYFALAVDTFLTVPDPRLAVLKEAPRRYRAIRIKLTEPASSTPS